jgi:3-dehydroquinate dehydratase type II
VLIECDVGRLATEGRPLSQAVGLRSCYRLRKPLYESWSEYRIYNDEPSAAALRIKKGAWTMKILIINGPNLNLLGIREPELYGSRTLAELEEMIAGHCAALGIEADFFQSNHEGAIVDAIQQAYKKYDGHIINPAAYTHTSIAIPDAIKAVGLPAVEVHISDISKREPYRRLSYVSDACIGTVAGLRFEGYLKAVDMLRKGCKRAADAGNRLFTELKK